MDEKQKYVKVPVDLFRELIDAAASIKALESYVREERYIIGRDTIARICGFELEAGEGW